MSSRNNIEVRLTLPSTTISDLEALAETFELDSNQCTAVAVLIAQHIVKAAKLAENFELWRTLHLVALESVEQAAEFFKLTARQRMAVGIALGRALELVPEMGDVDLFNLAQDLDNFRNAKRPSLKLVPSASRQGLDS